MKIGIDFDRVLFKTEDFKEHLFNEFEEFEETYEKAVKNGFYEPRTHAELMNTTVGKIFQELQNTSKFLYEDVGKIQKLRDSFEVVIVSRGDPVFQRGKIVDSGVRKYIDDYFIVQEKPKDTVEIDFLVDDREKELERVDVPGFLFDREKHSVDDIIRKVKQLDG